MSRKVLGLAAWRWSACALGLASLAVALVAERLGSPALGTCLHPAAPAGLGHCPLCWTAAFAFAAAATPSPRIATPIQSRSGR